MIVGLFPGQGVQHQGMGIELFDEFPMELARADEILGYSLRTLCGDDPDGLLDRTDHTQPALYVVAAMQYLNRRAGGRPEPAAAAGHSLGEYAALFAAGVFDFETGLRLVRERGRLMNQAPEGAMAAVIGADAVMARRLLDEGRHDAVDVANYNAPTQIVLSGPRTALDAAALSFQQAGFMVLPLKVSAAFHSRLMTASGREFADFLTGFEFAPPRVPVIANATARPYPTEQANIRDLLARQIYSPVRWTESMEYLLSRGYQEFEEVGPGLVLTKLLAQIRKASSPLAAPTGAAGALAGARERGPTAALVPIAPSPAARERRPPTTAKYFGGTAFCRAHNVRYAYYAGAMYKAISSPEMVVALGRAGMLGILGVGAVPLQQTCAAIDRIRLELGGGEAWGVNLLASPDEPVQEMAAVAAYLEHEVPLIEVSAFVSLSPAVVHFRYSGSRRGPDGTATAVHRVIAKVSRPEVARQFMQPAPAAMVDALVKRGLLSEEEAWCASRLPVADDICVESDSGGHTDGGSPFALVPAIIALRDRLPMASGGPVRVGAAGGIGTPSAIVAALMLGAEFVCTGSINQCTVEAGTSSEVKDILQDLAINDFAYAPAGDMFELGAQVQVVRKGLFFPARARRLHDLYRHYDDLDALPADVRRQLEERFFGCSIDEVWAQTRAWLDIADADAVARAVATPKQKMALVFRWYFHKTSEYALAGRREHQVNFQIHSGPALGAFNAWAQGKGLESWRDRQVADVAQRLLDGAATLLDQRLQQLFPQVSDVG
jgi:trans-AT polyketide synthase/acyltransferase/oxidoreductase domain-containing protein